MTQLERVPAARLRPGDVVYACDRECIVADVQALRFRVRLRLNPHSGHESSRVFAVPHATHFKRVIQRRRINMRPDLGARRGTRGTQTPDAITARIRTRRGAR